MTKYIVHKQQYDPASCLIVEATITIVADSVTVDNGILKLYNDDKLAALFTSGNWLSCVRVEEK